MHLKFKDVTLQQRKVKVKNSISSMLLYVLHIRK